MDWSPHGHIAYIHDHDVCVNTGSSTDSYTHLHSFPPIHQLCTYSAPSRDFADQDWVNNEPIVDYTSSKAGSDLFSIADSQFLSESWNADVPLTFTHLSWSPLGLTPNNSLLAVLRSDYAIIFLSQTSPFCPNFAPVFNPPALASSLLMSAIKESPVVSFNGSLPSSLLFLPAATTTFAFSPLVISKTQGFLEHSCLFVTGGRGPFLGVFRLIRKIKAEVDELNIELITLIQHGLPDSCIVGVKFGGLTTMGHYSLAVVGSQSTIRILTLSFNGFLVSEKFYSKFISKNHCLPACVLDFDFLETSLHFISFVLKSDGFCKVIKVNKGQNDPVLVKEIPVEKGSKCLTLVDSDTFLIAGNLLTLHNIKCQTRCFFKFKGHCNSICLSPSKYCISYVDKLPMDLPSRIRSRSELSVVGVPKLTEDKLFHYYKPNIIESVNLKCFPQELMLCLNNFDVFIDKCDSFFEFILSLDDSRTINSYLNQLSLIFSCCMTLQEEFTPNFSTKLSSISRLLLKTSMIPSDVQPCPICMEANTELIFNDDYPFLMSRKCLHNHCTECCLMSQHYIDFTRTVAHCPVCFGLFDYDECKEVSFSFGSCEVYCNRCKIVPLKPGIAVKGKRF
ncbi:hypothetical protein P9112_011944 [Eukaryota sp. TZLM1-RC]